MNNKKLFLFLAVICCCLFIGGVSAFLSTTDSKTNSMTIGYVETEIEEEFDPPQKMEPGISFKKKVSIKNAGPNDCYVRVLVEFSNSEMGNLCTLDYNTSDWTYNSLDGYWYYNHVLASGETSSSLFNTVKISEDADANDFLDFDILVYHESSNKQFNK